jgi:hypothetical protein
MVTKIRQTLSLIVGILCKIEPSQWFAFFKQLEDNEDDDDDDDEDKLKLFEKYSFKPPL